MPKYEVRVVYKGSSTYIVEAQNEDEAIDKAKASYGAGDCGVQTGAEEEWIEKFSVDEMEE